MVPQGGKIGHTLTQYNLRECYRRGKGVEQNLNEARKWLEKTADQGDKSAKELLDKM